jgi:hypothetical protein
MRPDRHVRFGISGSLKMEVVYLRVFLSRHQANTRSSITSNHSITTSVQLPPSATAPALTPNSKTTNQMLGSHYPLFRSKPKLKV